MTKLTCEPGIWTRYSSLLVLIILVALTLFAGMHGFSQRPSSSPSASFTDAHRIFWLKGSAISGWNGSRPGPTITVSSGDKVTIMLLSADAPDVHDWYLSANESATKSPDFNSGTIPLNWTFTPTIGVNIPHGGDWTYLCLYHQAIMRGTFRILPEASFGYSPASPTVRQPVSFDASTSKPSIAGSITTYSWNFGDGNKTSIGGPMISHSYSSPGSFNVSLTIADNQSNSDTLSKIVNVVTPGVDINANPTTSGALVNSQASSTITVASNGSFTGMVRFSETSSPSSGLSCTFTPTNVTLGSSASSILACSSVTPTTYSVTVFATSGTVGNLTSVTFTFQDFQIVASTPANTNTGVSATSTITVTAVNGYARIVSLSDTVPSGVTCGPISPTSLTGSGTAMVTCSSAIAGNYTVTVEAAGGITHNSSFVLEVVQAPSKATGLNFDELLEISGAVGTAILVLVIALVFSRRNRKRA